MQAQWTCQISCGGSGSKARWRCTRGVTDVEALLRKRGSCDRLLATRLLYMTLLHFARWAATTVCNKRTQLLQLQWQAVFRSQGFDSAPHEGCTIWAPLIYSACVSWTRCSVDGQFLWSWSHVTDPPLRRTRCCAGLDVKNPRTGPGLCDRYPCLTYSSSQKLETWPSSKFKPKKEGKPIISHPAFVFRMQSTANPPRQHPAQTRAT